MTLPQPETSIPTHRTKGYSLWSPVIMGLIDCSPTRVGEKISTRLLLLLLLLLLLRFAEKSGGVSRENKSAKKQVVALSDFEIRFYFLGTCTNERTNERTDGRTNRRTS